jgi:glycosyltransferase involved in cell wall biosynthesis
VKRCALNVTSQEEAKTSAARIRNAGVKIIPNGVDIPDADQGRVWRPDGRTRLLFIGRLHPIKGIENLLQALARLPENDYELQICGTGEAGYVSSLHQLACKLGLVDRVTFSGYVDGSEKFRVFHNTDVCVVPSFTENFGNVAAESLALGVPVIASRGTPWREVEERGCGLWVDNSPESLWEAIHTMHARDLAEMGQRGRRWMEECFGWDMIAAQMYGVYEELLAPEYK